MDKQTNPNLPTNDLSSPAPGNAIPSQGTNQWKKYSLLAGIALLGILLGAGGVYVLQQKSSGSDVVTGKHTPTPSSTSSVTPTRTPNAPKVLFHDARGGISLADADGSHIEHIIKGDQIGYAGVSADKKTIYYTDFDRPNGTVTLKQHVLTTGGDAALTQFRPSSLLWNIDEVNGPGFEVASVRPDGKYALLYTKEGLLLYDVLAKSSKTLLKHTLSPAQSCGETASASGSWLSWLVKPAHAAAVCDRYANPRYSEDGTLALVTVQYYEGAGALVIDPMTGKTIKEFDRFSGDIKWAGSKSLVQSGTGTKEMGTELSYYSSPTATPVQLMNIPAVGQGHIWGFAPSSKNILVIGSKTGAEDYAYWLVNPQSKSHQLIDDTHARGTIHDAIWLDDTSVLISTNGRTNKLNVTAKTVHPWVDQAISPIAVFK